MFVPMALSNPYIVQAAWPWVSYCQRIRQPFSTGLPFNGIQPNLLLHQVLFGVLRCQRSLNKLKICVIFLELEKSFVFKMIIYLMNRVNYQRVMSTPFPPLLNVLPIAVQSPGSLAWPITWPLPIQIHFSSFSLSHHLQPSHVEFCFSKVP